MYDLERKGWEDEENPETRKKNSRKRIDSQKKRLSLQNERKKALTELSAPLEVEVTDLLWEDNID